MAVRTGEASLGAAADLDRGLDLLGDVKVGREPALLRLYRPQPTVAFGQRDARLPGFAAACEASLGHGFVPVVRRAGGRAAAYHRGCLVVDHIQPEPDAMIRAKGRFGFFGEFFADVLRGLGVDAAMGEIPGEYCPGEYSVHGNGRGPASGNARRIKLVGTAQRVVAGAWLFSSVIVVEDSQPVRDVLVDVYEALGLDWEPSTAGGAADLVPGLSVEAVEKALLAGYGTHTLLVA